MMRPFSCAVCALKALQNSMMLTPCWPSAGPTGGAGFACPPGICSLIVVRIFFAISRSSSCLFAAPKPLKAVASRPLRLGTRETSSVDLLHLVEAELDRDLALEDVDEHLQLLLVGVDVDDLAVEVAERAGGDLHLLAEDELDQGARALGGR